MKRSQVLQQYTWNKEDIFASAGEWEKENASLNKAMVEVLKFKGKLGVEADFLACMECFEALSLRIEKLYCYAALYSDENASLNQANQLKMRAESMFVDFSSSCSFITPELASLDKQILEGYGESPLTQNYHYMISNILRELKHILSDKEEKLLSMAGNIFNGFSTIFGMIDNVDMPFGYVIMDGKRVKLTHGRYAVMLQNSSQAVRKNGFMAMASAVNKNIHTLSANYACSVKKDNYFAKIRGYENALAKSMSDDDVPMGVYTTLINAVNDNLSPLHDYIAFRKQALGVQKLNMYDLHTSIVKDVDLGLDFENAYQLVLAGLAPMGEEYIANLKKAKDSRWIDVYETECKRSGAYSMGVSGVHPYVLLNHSGTTHDVFTIAHEMGHAMHSFYSSSAQTYANADYSIFVAEVASTVNEVLLLKYLLKTEVDPQKRKFFLSYYLDMFRTTLFRQTMFAEFEMIVHAADAEGESLTLDFMNAKYLKLNQKYYGASVTHNSQIKQEWARIPHFYNAFYVYKYATGITSAVKLANSILNDEPDAITKYKTFLRAGGSKSPYDILRDAGVDLNTSTPYQIVMQEFADTLAQLKDLFVDCKDPQGENI